MSRTGSKHALAQSARQRVGVVPYWVETYDEVVYFDTTTQTVRCLRCKEEVKNLAWVKTHMADCFGIKS